uniref:Uncharacterized protein n=1 Tax=Arion vulgaris TaxID=1028688 RepID=A0A0B6YU51_9EUPU
MKKCNKYRPRKRPRTRWSDGIKNCCKKMNNSSQSALEQAQARSLHFPPSNTSIKK